MPGYQPMVWSAPGPLWAPCVASKSDTLPASLFSCLLFSLFTFQELLEVIPVCLYPASVLIFVFSSSFPPGQPQLKLVAAEQQSLLTCSIPGELIQSLSVCGSLQRAPAQSCTHWQLALLLNVSWNELNVRVGELGGWGAEHWIPEGNGAREERTGLKNILEKSTDIPQAETQGGSAIWEVLRFYEFYNEIEEL